MADEREVERHRRDLGLAVWAALLRVHAGVVPHVEAELLAARGLPLQWYDVLLELEHAPRRRLRMQELGERAVLSRSRVSRIVDELVAVGLVARQPDDVDGRAVHAVITASGRSRLRRSAPTYVDAITRHVTDRLTAGELETMRSALERLVSAHE